MIKVLLPKSGKISADEADALAGASTIETDPKKREQLVKAALAEYRGKILIFGGFVAPTIERTTAISSMQSPT